MTFKYQLKADIDAVFVNPDEFATEHVIDDVPVLCVVEDMDAVPNEKSIGTHTRTIKIYIKASLLPGRPLPDAPLSVDGKRWKVASVAEEFGILTMKLEAMRT